MVCFTCIFVKTRSVKDGQTCDVCIQLGSKQLALDRFIKTTKRIFYHILNINLKMKKKSII